MSERHTPSAEALVAAGLEGSRQAGRELMKRVAAGEQDLGLATPRRRNERIGDPKLEAIYKKLSPVDQLRALELLADEKGIPRA